MVQMQDEYERHQSNKAFKYLGIFYGISLAVWGLYNLIVNGNPGVPFVLFVIGQIMYLFVINWSKWKMNRMKEDE